MTLREKAICECYTGICFCTGNERTEIYKYLTWVSGRKIIFTHDILRVIEENKKRIKDDFIDVCRGVYK